MLHTVERDWMACAHASAPCCSRYTQAMSGTACAAQGVIRDEPAENPLHEATRRLVVPDPTERYQLSTPEVIITLVHTARWLANTPESDSMDTQHDNRTETRRYHSSGWYQVSD